MEWGGWGGAGGGGWCGGGFSAAFASPGFPAGVRRGSVGMVDTGEIVAGHVITHSQTTTKAILRTARLVISATRRLGMRRRTPGYVLS